MYSTSRISKFLSPDGVVTLIISPLFLPIRALPIGLLKKIKFSSFHIKFIITSKEAPEYKITSSDFENFAKKRKIPFLLKSKIGIEDINNLGLKKIVCTYLSHNQAKLQILTQL